MKKNLIFVFFGSGILWYLFSAHNSGAAFGGLGDQTGSPLSVSNCASCHNGGNFSPLVTVTLTDSNGQVVNGYKPGASYTLEINVTAGSGNPIGYGVQAVALDNTNQNAGTFDSIYTANTRITNYNNRQYLEQDGFKQDGTFSVKWTAPRYLSFNVTFYVVGLISDGFGNMEGDETSVPLQFSLPPDNGIYYPKMDYCKNEPDPSPVFVGVSNGGSFFGQTGIIFADSLGTIDLNNSTSGNYTINYVVPGAPQIVSADISILESDSVDISFSNNPFYILDGGDTIFTLDAGGCNPLVLPQVLHNTDGYFYATDTNIVFSDPIIGQIDIMQSLSNCGGDCGNFGLVYQSNGICPDRDTVLVKIFICVATEHLKSENNFEIFPNPVVNDFLYIKTFNQKTPESIKFYNQIGQLICDKKIDSTNTEKIFSIELPDNLSKGIFTIKIISGASEEHFRIIRL